MTTSSPSPSSPSPEEIGDALHTAAIHLLRRLRRVDQAAGPTAPQLSALSVLVFGGPLTLGELARAEQVRPASISTLVRGLQERGLVQRETDRADRRVVRVRASAEGRRVMRLGKGRRVAALAARLRELPPRELDRIAQGTAALRRLLSSWR